MKKSVQIHVRIEPEKKDKLVAKIAKKKLNISQWIAKKVDEEIK
jgi:predicted HicB family RNase H-like nuclease